MSDSEPKKKILVVEDEENLRELVQSRLEQNGYEVATAGDGFTAVSKARSFEPTVKGGKVGAIDVQPRQLILDRIHYRGDVERGEQRLAGFAQRARPGLSLKPFLRLRALGGTAYDDACLMPHLFGLQQREFSFGLLKFLQLLGPLLCVRLVFRLQ